MKILNHSAGADTGGQSIRIKQAFDHHSDWEYRSAVRSLNYIRYPRDAPFAQARHLAAWADVIHLNNTFRGRPPVKKPLVIHHHGTHFRNNPQPFLTQAAQLGAVAIVSTLDLWLLAPTQTEWVGAPFDLDWLATFRQPVDDDVLRIAHSPTNRAIKSTDQFLAAARRLGTEIEVEVILSERVDWATCLKQKGRADIFFDQVTYGYGNATIEAWGMGMPVIAGASDAVVPGTLAEMRRRFGKLPFYEATEDTIYEALRALADPKTRKTYANRGLAHARKHHAESQVVTQLEAVYNRAAQR